MENNNHNRQWSPAIHTLSSPLELEIKALETQLSQLPLSDPWVSNSGLGLHGPQRNIPFPVHVQPTNPFDIEKLRVHSSGRGQMMMPTFDPLTYPLNNFMINDMNEYLWQLGRMRSNNGFCDHYCQNYNASYNGNVSNTRRGLSLADGNAYGGGLRRDPSWEEIRGSFSLYVKDQFNCNLLMKKLERAPTKDVIKMLVSEVKVDVRGIVKSQCGSLFFQKLLDFCDDVDVTGILSSIMANERDFLEICVDIHGTHAVQKLIKRLKVHNHIQRYTVSSVLRGLVVALSKDMGGYYVLEECLKAFHGANDIIALIVEEVANHCLELAMDKSGCRMVQKCIEQNVSEDVGNRLLYEISTSAFQLSDHKFGNYVVQHMIEKKNSYRWTANIVFKLKGNFAYLSRNKSGSYVVEKCLNYGAPEQIKIITTEISDDAKFLEIAQHECGNFVIQAASRRAMGIPGLELTYRLLEERITSYSAHLECHPYGKRVLSCIKYKKVRM